MDQTSLIASTTLLLLVANGAPIIAHKLLGECCAWPVDGQRRFRDGRPWLGPSKTWRGIVAALAVTPLAALLLTLPWWFGALFALATLLGDLLSSFSKRRLGIESMGRATGLDQIPEALLPLLLAQWLLGMSALSVAIGVALFFILEHLLSIILYRLHIRTRPY